MDRILAAVDGPAPSLKAVALAADLAGKYGTELMLATVSQELSTALLAVLDTYVRQENSDSRIAELASAHAENLLAGARLEAQAKGATRISTRSSAGDPAEEIIALATEWRSGFDRPRQKRPWAPCRAAARQRRAKGFGAPLVPSSSCADPE